MSIAFHPAAAANADERASALVPLVQEFVVKVADHPSFSSELYVAANIPDADIIGPVEVRRSDYRGRTTANFFYVGDKQYGIAGEGYQLLHKLVSAITGIKDIGRQVSDDFVETILFDWIRRRFKKEPVAASFSSFLLAQANSSIKKVTTWVPIAYLEVESPFPISNSEVRPISIAILNQWAERAAASSDNVVHTAEAMNDVRKKLQGLAAVVTVTEAEPERVLAIALEEAETVTSILGVFSGATLLADVKCASRIKGSENIAEATCLFEIGGALSEIRKMVVDRASMRQWRISNDELNAFRSVGLDTISTLLKLPKPSEFQNAVLTSLFIYAKAAFTADPIEKIIYVLASLESILLKNQSEPIQQNLAERMAIFVGTDLAKRKQIVKSVKDVYDLRSRYLHHGQSMEEMDSIREFLMTVWSFHTQLIANADRFNTKLEFLTAIDDVKMS